MARGCPGARTWRPRLHRWGGVTIGEDAWIGYDCILETSRPDLIKIGKEVVISVRVTLVAHFRGQYGIEIEDRAFVGPGSVILPGVTIGEGAVVSAGSVVTSSVPKATLVQGNPARPVARCSADLAGEATMAEFLRTLRPLDVPSK